MFSQQKQNAAPGFPMYHGPYLQYCDKASTCSEMSLRWLLSKDGFKAVSASVQLELCSVLHTGFVGLSQYGVCRGAALGKTAGAKTPNSLPLDQGTDGESHEGFGGNQAPVRRVGFLLGSSRNASPLLL